MSICLWSGWLSVRADPDEDHSDKDEDQVENLRAEVAFLEDEDSAGEGDDDRTAADQGHDRDHRRRVVQGCEICEVTDADEYGYQRNGPAPAERGGLMSLWVPEHCAYHGHDQKLVEVEPALGEHRAEHLHHMLVVESAHGSCHGGSRHAPYPSVVPEVYILLFAGAAHQEYGQYRQKDARPLIYIEKLFKIY